MKPPIKFEDIQKNHENNTISQKSMAELNAQRSELLSNIRKNILKFKTLLEKINSRYGYEDNLYRFYHHSYKVFALQELTDEIVIALQEVNPQGRLNPLFMQIIESGTGLTFKPDVNANWFEVTRPIVEAFIHCKYFVEMIIIYEDELEELPNPMPSGLAAVLTLFCLQY